MPSGRLLKILLLTACALIFTLAAVLIMRRPPQSSKPFEMPMQSARKIEVVIGTTTLTLSLTKEKDYWNVSAGDVGPFKAEPNRMLALQGELQKVSVEDVISESGSNPADFGVDPQNAMTIKVFSDEKTLTATGIFGKPAEDGLHTYFRYPEQKPIYLARVRMRLNTIVSEWRDHALVNAPEDHVLTLVIQGPGFETTLIRTTDTWRLNETVVNPDPIFQMLGVLAHLRTDEFVDLHQFPELAAPKLTYATILIQLKDGITQTLHIGKLEPKSKRYPVSVNNQPSVGWIPEATIKSVLRKPADFKPLATTSPATAGSPAKAPGK